jgi:phage portal protein BeeE
VGGRELSNHRNDLSHSTFTNSQTTGRWFGQFPHVPWCRKIEAEFQRSVIGDATGELHIEIDLLALMRGSYVERRQANVAAVQAGILMVNEVREQEGFNPLPVDTVPPNSAI